MTHFLELVILSAPNQINHWADQMDISDLFT